METMRVLELFSGTASFSNVAKARGHDVLTLDNDERFHPDILKDIRAFDPERDLPKDWRPEIVWASPPCECFTVNTIGMNWTSNAQHHLVPKSVKASIALILVDRTIGLIEEMEPRFYVIENPRAMLRNHRPLSRFPRKTVTYCQYGDNRMKPTDLWTNIPFQPRSCNYGDPCHPRTPRGCYTRESYKELARVPPRLCEELLTVCERCERVNP